MDDVLWAVSLMDMRDNPDDTMDVTHIAAVFRGPNAAEVEAQGINLALSRFPVNAGWVRHSASACSVLPLAAKFPRTTPPP